MCDGNEDDGLNSSIVPSFMSSLDQDVLDAVVDFGEAGIDSVVDAGLLSAVPVLRAVIGVHKTVRNLRDRNFAMQVSSFLQGMHDGTLDIATLEAHIAQLEEDLKHAEKELGYVLILVDKNADTRRSRLQGKLYKAFVMGNIGWSDFVDYCEVLSRCMMSDFSTLRKVWLGELEVSSASNAFRVERLASLGLVSRTMKSIVPSGNAMETRYFLSMTQFGETLCRHVLADAV